jgi:hypothetical protein
VRINLLQMANASNCQERFVVEKLLPNGSINYTMSPLLYGNISDACVHVLDLTSKHFLAKGFRRGFLGYPYGYLSPSDEPLLVRLDLEHFSLTTTRMVDLSPLGNIYGGYSGGFADGTIACFK